MTSEEMRDLERGDIVRIKGSGISFVVDGNYDSHVIVVRTMEMTNPSEWEICPVRDKNKIKKILKFLQRHADKVLIKQRGNEMDAKTKATLEAMQKASERAARIREARERFMAKRRA